MSTPGKFLLTSDALMIIVFITFLIWKVPPQWLVEYWSDPPSPANLVADVPPWPKLQIHSGNCLHMTEGAEAYWKSCTHEPEALKCYPPSTLRKYLTPGKTRWLDRAPNGGKTSCWFYEMGKEGDKNIIRGAAICLFAWQLFVAGKHVGTALPRQFRGLWPE